MTSEHLETIRQRLWRPLSWLGLVFLATLITCLVLQKTGHLEKAALDRIVKIGIAITMGSYVLISFATLELRLRGGRLRFEDRPVLFCLGYAVAVLFFIFCFWQSLGIDR